MQSGSLHLSFRGAVVRTFTHAKKGSIFIQIYELRMTDKSFSGYSDYNDIFEDFLQKEPNSAFYTALGLIPDDFLCKVYIAIFS